MGYYDMDLRDVPGGLKPEMEQSIEAALLAQVREEAKTRNDAVARGNETPTLAAALLDKFGWGISKTASALGVRSTHLQREVDRLVREIDTNFDEHRKKRWAAQPAGIVFVDKERNQGLTQKLTPGDVITHKVCGGGIQEHVFTGTDGAWICGYPTNDTAMIERCRIHTNDISPTNVTHVNRIAVEALDYAAPRRRPYEGLE